MEAGRQSIDEEVAKMIGLTFTLALHGNNDESLDAAVDQLSMQLGMGAEVEVVIADDPEREKLMREKYARLKPYRILAQSCGLTDWQFKGGDPVLEQLKQAHELDELDMSILHSAYVNGQRKRTRPVDTISPKPSVINDSKQAQAPNFGRPSY